MFEVNGVEFHAERVGEMIKNGWDIGEFQTITTHTMDELFLKQTS